MCMQEGRQPDMSRIHAGSLSAGHGQEICRGSARRTWAGDMQRVCQAETVLQEDAKGERTFVLFG